MFKTQNKMLQENYLCSNGFHTENKYFSLFCFQIVKLECQFSVLAEFSSVVLELLFCSLALSNSYYLLVIRLLTCKQLLYA